MWDGLGWVDLSEDHTDDPQEDDRQGDGQERPERGDDPADVELRHS